MLPSNLNKHSSNVRKVSSLWWIGCWVCCCPSRWLKWLASISELESFESNGIKDFLFHCYMFTSIIQTIDTLLLSYNNLKEKKSKLVFRFAQRLIILKRLKSLQWESVSCASTRLDTNFKIEINSISRIFLNS